MVTNPATVAAEIAPLPEGASFLLSGRHALLSPDAPALRLSSAGWIDLTPAGLIDITSTELLYGLAFEKIITRISPFSKRIRLFVERYFKFMQAQIQTFDQPDPATEIFTREDWIFSIWLPLPHAQILLPSDFKKNEPSFAEFDLAFWTGEKLICIQFEQSQSNIKSKRDKINYLEAHHPDVKIISIPRNKLSDAEGAFPSDLFDESFFQFRKGLNLPQGPSPSPVLTSAFRNN